MEDFISVLFLIISVIIASTFHEFAHAWTAYQLGDLTAKSQGRLTLNPLKHIDPLGAIMLVLIGFGWSKPVPVNPNNFEKPVLDNAVVAAAGPISNLIMIALVALPLRLLQFVVSPEVFNILLIFAIPFIRINSILALFNLIPIPPLDGSRIIKVILPKSLRYAWESLDRYGFIILMALLLLPFSPFPTFLSNFFDTGMNLIMTVALGL
jgi:Zn-dependent protease